MKKRLYFSLFAAAAFFLMSCARKSVLILETDRQPEACAAEENGMCLESSADDGGTVPTIMVHVCGKVLHPGVYELPEGSRVYEAVQLAGGFASDAAEEYLNLAETVSDGEKLVVPSVQEVEEEQADPCGRESEGGSSGLVNINTAGAGTLVTLPGIGQTRAEAIISWRTEHGPFQRPEDIMQVPGIKEALYEKIKQLITT